MKPFPIPFIARWTDVFDMDIALPCVRLAAVMAETLTGQCGPQIGDERPVVHVDHEELDRDAGLMSTSSCTVPDDGRWPVFILPLVAFLLLAEPTARIEMPHVYMWHSCLTTLPTAEVLMRKPLLAFRAEPLAGFRSSVPQ